MEIAVLAVGRLKAGPEAELCSRYLERAARTGRSLGFSGFKAAEIAESRAARAPDRIASEALELASLLPSGGRAVGLDPRGALSDSEAFASDLMRDAEAGIGRTTFLVGGPDGLGEAVLDRADRRLSFGRLTWPHQLVRVLLAEQLYRAMTILSGHPYHRA